MFLAAAHLGLDPGGGKQCTQLPLDRVDVDLAILAVLFEILGDARVFVRLQIAKGQILEFGLDLPDAESIGERSVYLHGLLGDADLFVPGHGAERTHVVEAIGKLDQHHADIVHHRQEHLAQALGLLFLLPRRQLPTVPDLAGPRNLAELGDAVDEVGDAGAKLALDVLE